MEFEKKRKKVARVLIAIIVLLIAFIVYILVINNPKFKIKSAVSYVFKTADSSLASTQKSTIQNLILNNKVEMTSKIGAKISLNDDVIESFGSAGKSIETLINNLSLEYNIKTDLPNKYLDMGLSYSYDSEKVEANLYLDDNEQYIYLKNYFNKYIDISKQYADLSQYLEIIKSQVTPEELRYLMGILEKSVSETIEYGKISNSKVEIDVGGEMLPVTKNTLTIDTELMNKFQKILLNNIMIDEKAKEMIIRIASVYEEYDIASLETDIRIELSHLESDVSVNEVFGEYSIYTSGIFNKVVRNELKAIEKDDLGIIQYTTYNALEFDSQFSMYSNNEMEVELNIKETSKDNYIINCSSKEGINISIKGLINSSNIDVDYTITMSGINDITGDIMAETTNMSNKETNEKVSFTLNAPDSFGTINITMDGTVKLIDSITKPIIIERTDIDKLTSTDMQIMIKNFQNKNPKLIQIINDIVNSQNGLYL